MITETGTHTAADLAELVADQARAISQVTPPGSAVAVHSSNSPEFLASLYAVPAAGRVLVPVNTRSSRAEKVDQLDRAHVTLLLGDPVDGFGGPTRSLPELVAGPPPDRPVEVCPRPDPGDTAWLLFTSGSTGMPKGVRCTHASLAAGVAVTAAARPLADDEVYLFPFPLFHVAAYNVVHAHVRHRPVVLPDRFDARRILELCRIHGVTSLSVAATMLRMLLDAISEDPEGQAPASLRTVAYGAAPMPEGLLREASAVLGCDFAQGYGSTELSGNAVFLGPAAHRRGLAGETRLLRAAGYPGPGVDLAILDDAGHVMPAGTPGEITIAADQVCAGYLDDPAATARAIRNGRLHTGDIGVVDDDGLLTVVDRAKDIVVTGGENVASRAIENAARAHPRIVDVAVVGIPDDVWGEAVTAVVVLRDADQADRTHAFRAAPPALVAEVQALVTDRVAGYAKPRSVWLTEALPLNANGKVDKPALRTSVAQAAGVAPDPSA